VPFEEYGDVGKGAEAVCFYSRTGALWICEIGSASLFEGHVALPV